MRSYACVFVTAAVLAVLGTPIVTRIARAMGLLDYPATRRIHSVPVPRVGGMALLVAVLGPAVAVIVMNPAFGEALPGVGWRVAALLTGAVSMLAVGMVDDVRGLHARTKLVAEILAAAAVAAMGIRIEHVAVGGGVVLEFGWLAWPITIFWIVGVTNAINLIDGLDGLAAGIAAIACAAVAVFAICTGQPVMAIVVLALLGSLLGFLVFNFNPARVFLGDSGTLFIGFVIGAASAQCAAATSDIVGLALPGLVLGVPILDTLLAMVRRVLERRSLFAPDTSHIHHRLLDQGIRHRHVVLILYAVTLAAAILSLPLLFVRGTDALVIGACVVALHVLFFRMAGTIRVHATLAVIRRNRLITRLARQATADFQMAELELRRPTRFEPWWDAVCAAAREMAIARLTLLIRDRTGRTHTLVWTCDRNRGSPGDMVRLALPIRDRRSGFPLSAEIEVRVSGSLEVACRRVALFARLFDEHSLANLRPPAPAATMGRQPALSIGVAGASVVLHNQRTP
jgi:UDP-GlcNAc:undecaprenyl-phosphate/decaprenyl-phosphate GlcNAc-1-phosphate transferase